MSTFSLKSRHFLTKKFVGDDLLRKEILGTTDTRMTMAKEEREHIEEREQIEEIGQHDR